MYRLLKSDPAIIQEINDHFVLVMVDVNERDSPPRNKPLVESLGKPLVRGIPVLLVLNADGKLLNDHAAERLRDDAYTHPEEVLAYLRKWSR